jgi:predicted amidophosphoribosyltransferase
LLVDDVITTGSTLEECALVLLQAGASSVHCAALAQADGHSAEDVDAEEAEI